MLRKMFWILPIGFLFLIGGAKSKPEEKSCSCSHEIPDGYVPDNTLICNCGNTHTGKGSKCIPCQKGNHTYITYAEYRKLVLKE
jgi:hypothetical protein